MEQLEEVGFLTSALYRRNKTMENGTVWLGVLIFVVGMVLLWKVTGSKRLARWLAKVFPEKGGEE